MSNIDGRELDKLGKNIKSFNETMGKANKEIDKIQRELSDNTKQWATRGKMSREQYKAAYLQSAESFNTLRYPDGYTSLKEKLWEKITKDFFDNTIDSVASAGTKITKVAAGAAQATVNSLSYVDAERRKKEIATLDLMYQFPEIVKRIDNIKGDEQAALTSLMFNFNNLLRIEKAARENEVNALEREIAREKAAKQAGSRYRYSGGGKLVAVEPIIYDAKISKLNGDLAVAKGQVQQLTDAGGIATAIINYFKQDFTAEEQSRPATSPLIFKSLASQPDRVAVQPRQDAQSKLDQLNTAEQARLELLQRYRTMDLENLQRHEESKTTICLAAEQQRMEKETELNEKKEQDKKERQERLAKQIDEINAFQRGLSSSSEAVGGLMNIAEMTGGKDSAAYQRLFGLSKGFAVAQAMVKLQLAMMQALTDDTATSPAAKFANMAAVAAAGVGVLSTLTSITYSGQAHAGIDFIPREGTWLLDRGERVVDSRTNADLKQFLRGNAQAGGGASLSINMPVVVENNNAGSNADLSPEGLNQLAGLIKNKVYEVVSNEQRPGGLLNRGAYA